ncbi:MAG: class I SAM-dependent methyltransferase [Candidatus Binatia bacterium]
MNRVLEPEVMDDPAHALAYARADFAAVNQGFVDRFFAFAPAVGATVVDLGCGPADIPLRLAAARPDLRCVGIDASIPMLRLARPHARVFPVAARLGALPLATGFFDAVVSNSLLHHLPDPDLLWHEVRRLGRSGASVLVMDLHRPASADAARAIVDGYAAGEAEVLRRDFYHSLLAAFTEEEVRTQLRANGLDLACAVVSDRHWVASGRLS